MLDLPIEQLLRLQAFGWVFGIMIVLELLAPRRPEPKRWMRWPANFAVLGLSIALVAGLPWTPLGAALIAIDHHFGLFFWYPLPLWWQIGISVVLLDLVVYWQHRVFHRYAWGWRLHRMHHTDKVVDATTGFRFHPVEIAVSALIKVGAVLLLGAPLLGVLIFEALLNACAMFNHSNLRLPGWLDRPLRWIIVTPDMHRVHHSVDPKEHHRNFGFCLSLWDRLFGSYTPAPAAGHINMQIGLPDYPSDDELRLRKMLDIPLRNPK